MKPSVLQLISSIGLYGAERVLLELGTFFKGQGWHSHVGIFCNQGQALPEVAVEAQRRGLITHCFCANKPLDGQVIDAIGEYALNHKINIIHSHGYRPDVHLALARLPTFTKRMATCHTWYTRSLKLLIYEFLDKIALHAMDQVVVVSPQLMDEVIAVGIPATQSTLIENGISALSPTESYNKEKTRRELNISQEDKVILRVGRLDVDKGNDLLLQAMTKVLSGIKAKLVFAGDGEQQNELEMLAQKLGIMDNVVFLGYRRDIPALLNISDLFVISSLKEGLPMVLLEAMAARVPIVSTAVGAIPLTLRNGIDGILVPPNDISKLSTAMLEMFQMPQHKDQMIESAYLRFQQHHSQEAMGKKYLQLYEQLL